MEKMWRIANVEHLCGTNTLENRRLENIKTRYNGVVHEPNGRIEHATEDYELGKDRQRQGGTNWGFLGLCWNNRGKTVLLFGVRCDWIPCGCLAYFRLGKIERIKYPLFFFVENMLLE